MAGITIGCGRIYLAIKDYRHINAFWALLISAICQEAKKKKKKKNPDLLVELRIGNLTGVFSNFTLDVGLSRKKGHER